MQSRLQQGDSSCGRHKYFWCSGRKWRSTRAPSMSPPLGSILHPERCEEKETDCSSSWKRICRYLSRLVLGLFQRLFSFFASIFCRLPMQTRCGRTLSAAAETLAASSNNWFCNECGRPFKMEKGKGEKMKDVIKHILEVLWRKVLCHLLITTVKQSCIQLWIYWIA